MRRAISCLAREQEVAFRARIALKMLTSCPCDGGFSKNVISQSDRSTRATCDVARTVKNDRDTEHGAWFIKYRDIPQKYHFTFGFCMLNFSIAGCPSDANYCTFRKWAVCRRKASSLKKVCLTGLEDDKPMHDIARIWTIWTIRTTDKGTRGLCHAPRRSTVLSNQQDAPPNSPIVPKF
jgi:hypothetical protein